MNITSDIATNPAADDKIARLFPGLARYASSSVAQAACDDLLERTGAALADRTVAKAA